MNHQNQHVEDPSTYSLKAPKRGRNQLRNADPHSQSLHHFYNDKSPARSPVQEHTASQKVLSLRGQYGHRPERSPRPAQSTRSYKTPRKRQKMKNSSSTKAVKGVSVGRRKDRGKSGKRKKNKSQKEGSSGSKLGGSGVSGGLKGSYVSIQKERQKAKKRKDGEGETGKKGGKARVKGRGKSKPRPRKRDPPKMNFSKKNRGEKVKVDSKEILGHSEEMRYQNAQVSNTFIAII